MASLKETEDRLVYCPSKRESCEESSNGRFGKTPLREQNQLLNVSVFIY